MTLSISIPTIDSTPTAPATPTALPSFLGLSPEDIRELAVVRSNHAAFHRRYVMREKERERRGYAERSHKLAPVAGAQSFAAVFDEH